MIIPYTTSEEIPLKFLHPFATCYWNGNNEKDLSGENRKHTFNQNELSSFDFSLLLLVDLSLCVIFPLCTRMM